MSASAERNVQQRRSTVTERRLISQRLKKDYPDRVPVVVWPVREPGEREEVAKEGRFLVARALTVGHFIILLREVLELGPHCESPIFLWVRDNLLGPLTSFRYLEENFTETDGFVYLYMSDMGGNAVEFKNLGVPLDEATAAAAASTNQTPRKGVDFDPPELARSLPRLRYPSPPEPDDLSRKDATGSTSFQRSPSDASQTSATSATTAAAAATAGAGVLSVLPPFVLPPLRTSAAVPPTIERPRRVFRGHPRPSPPAGLTPQVPSPPPSHMETWPHLFDEQLQARGAGPDVSDDEEVTISGQRLEEIQVALGLRTRSIYTDNYSSQVRDTTMQPDSWRHSEPFRKSSKVATEEEADEKLPLRVPAWLRDPRAPIQF